MEGVSGFLHRSSRRGFRVLGRVDGAGQRSAVKGVITSYPVAVHTNGMSVSSILVRLYVVPVSPWGPSILMQCRVTMRPHPT